MGKAVNESCTAGATHKDVSIIYFKISVPGSTYFNISASIPNVVNQYEGCKDFRIAHEIFASLTTQLCTGLPSYNLLGKAA